MKYLAFILLFCAWSAESGDLARQRLLFKTTYAAGLRGVTPRLANLRTLRDYPLYPYLQYQALMARLHTLPSPEIRAFLAFNPDTLIGSRLRTEWLRETARQGRFDLFIADYTPQSEPELRCHLLAHQLREKTPVTAMKAGLDLWLTGNAQPAACDAVFAALRERKILTDELVWRRVVLAAHAGNPRIATQIATHFGGAADQSLAGLLVKISEAPELTLQLPLLKDDTQKVRDLVAYGLSRLARLDVARGSAAWREARTRYTFSASDKGFVTREIALSAAAQHRPDLRDFLAQVNPEGVNEVIERLRLREGLRARDWQQIALWTAGQPRDAATNPLRWRYWHARALEQTGHKTEADALFDALAKERDYYGFLASDRRGKSYAIGSRAIAPTMAERTRINGLVGIGRAHEFYRLGLRQQASSELEFELGGRDKRAQEIGAVLTSDWGWAERTIQALGLLRSYDDLELRFPLLHQPQIEQLARQQGLPPAFIYSIVREESAFMTDARSIVGALGLMQLMPETARATAKETGIRLRSPAELKQADKNLALGSAYLAQVLHRFGGSFPLAAAAYNAGPSRVRTWLRAAPCEAADLWVETIPFAETEGYVRRALFYTAIYEWRLGGRVTSLATRMKDMTRPTPVVSREC